MTIRRSSQHSAACRSARAQLGVLIPVLWMSFIAAVSSADIPFPRPWPPGYISTYTSGFRTIDDAIGFDSSDNLYVAADALGIVKKVDKITGGVSNLVSGGCVRGFAVDPTGQYLFYSAATSGSNVRLFNVSSNSSLTIANMTGEGGKVYYNGCFYFAEVLSRRVKQLNLTTMAVTVVAGSGTWSNSTPNDNGPALSANLFPTDVAFNANGEMYIANGDAWTQYTGGIKKVLLNGTIISILSGFRRVPVSLVLDSSGGIYFAASITTQNGLSSRVFKISNDSSSTLQAVAGSGVDLDGTDTTGYSGDGGLATSALLSLSLGVALDSKGNLYISEYSNTDVRRVETGYSQPFIVEIYAGSNCSTGSFKALPWE